MKIVIMLEVINILELGSITSKAVSFTGKLGTMLQTNI